PYLYGQIAAANALSDVYAMGGRPVTALNIYAITDKLPEHVVSEILRGGYDKAAEANCIITGGHTIRSAEPLYGLAVTGLIDPRKIWKNDGARVGDEVIMTKVLGCGILLTAYKADIGLLDYADLEPALKNMAALNRWPAEIVAKHDVSCVTDITGFGLAGHALELAQGSNVTLRFRVADIPMYPQAIDMAEMGLVPSGAYHNRENCEGKVDFAPQVTLAQQDVVFDPQTSGGLLICVAPAEAEALLAELRAAGIPAAKVGRVETPGDFPLAFA
ncbi:MAG: selenide, water dikinase SelD, partial [Eggerthellaceae bacterium]|nr:selenide, water dikinase SelD [Eggerthellaceae bacterium]